VSTGVPVAFPLGVALWAGLLGDVAGDT
jgi:hypothetical protein